ncbi:MAG: tetratricopeptide repeat protein [Cyanobacteria bacterium P01_E01_bin.42]
MARPNLVEGTIDNAVARLSLWCRRETKGLARVSFSSEFARLQVEERLEFSLREGGIPFHNIDFPRWENPSVVFRFLLESLEAIDTGVVSVTGWATAIAREIPLSEGLRAINFNRESLVRPGLRQIWWMPRSFATEAIRVMPDLSSWFILRLSIDRENTPILPPITQQLPRGNAIRPPAWKRSPYLEKSIPPSQKITSIALQSKPSHNLPRSSAVFVGRGEELERLHQQLQQADRVAITGMGGVGKSELARQYALRYGEESYSGGICWLHSRDRDLGIQILVFCRDRLELFPPEGLSLLEQVSYCWTHWPQGNVAIVFDDVPDYDTIQAYLPPTDSRFKVLLTTRVRRWDRGIQSFAIGVLEEATALNLLQSFLSESLVEAEIETARLLCEWVGYLPLGLVLIGRYLGQKTDLSLANFLERLEEQKLEQKALRIRAPGMREELDIAAVFELSWQELNPQEQELLCFLGLFALAPIPWEFVTSSLSDREDLDLLRDRLIGLSIVDSLAEDTLQLHQLMREFAKRKIEESDRAYVLKQHYCQAMVEVAKQIPDTPILEEIKGLTPVISHLIEAATTLLTWVQDQDLIWPFIGLGRYYAGQGFYNFAEPWYEQCLSVVRDRLSEKNDNVADSLNNLALLYQSQGRYEEAEPLFVQALELSRKLLGEDHPHVATFLNNLALLYQSQGRYEEAEPLLIQALDLRRKLLGKDHLHVATSLNNLALLYKSQGRYEEAEPLYFQTLDLSRKLLGEDHPHVATSLNNLALLYQSQGRYAEAEPLYFQTLDLRRKLLGEDHPHVAASLNNLAALYQSQGRYEEAELLFVQALELKRKLLGEDHPHVAASLNNLAGLYESQGHYEEAESLYVRTIAIAMQKLGDNHPYTQTFSNNFMLFLQQVIRDNRESELSDDPRTQTFLSELKNQS